jgi:hypothetical protein
MAITHDKQTYEFDLKWSEIPGAAVGARPVRKQTDIQRIDGLVDRTLTAIRDGAVAQAEGADPNDDISEKVERFLVALFPAGVQAVTSLPVVEELAAVDAIVTKLEGSHAAAVVELELTRLSKRLATLAIDYRAAQEAPATTELSFDTVRAARAQGHEHLLQAVALIVGRYYSTTDEHVAARSTLLAPILKQNEAIRLYLRARRAVEDVDPETGEIDPNAPNSGELPPAAG